jgi:quercetin dioxygenase-like cupin family protein
VPLIKINNLEGNMFGRHSDTGYIEILPGIKIKTLNYGKNSLMTEFLLKKDSLLVEHTHMQEQTGYLISGKIKLYIANRSRTIMPGDSWSVPSNSKHKAEIIEDSVAIEIFSPCRENYIKFLNRDDTEE